MNGKMEIKGGKKWGSKKISEAAANESLAPQNIFFSVALSESQWTWFWNNIEDLQSTDT